MQTYITNSNSALRIAREVMQDGLKKPVLAFIKESAWDKLKSKDEVIMIEDPTSQNLSDFKDKAVIFCTYTHFNFEIEKISDDWQDYMDGDTVRIDVGKWGDVNDTNI